MSDFQSLGLSNTLLRAVEAEGYTTPTPVQEQSIPPLLEGCLLYTSPSPRDS